MTDADNESAPKANVEGVLAEFRAKEDLLGLLCARTKNLIEASLQDANIPYQSVQARVKTRKKVAQKFLDPNKNYQKLDDITDLAGLRIITYYEDDIERVAEVIKREFRIDLKNSVDKRDSEPDKFGYSALNYVCEHLGKRTSDVEYKKFANVRCEIQIPSILRHAWSEIEHEWYDLKDAYPKTVKRRFYRIAALLELAESEFLDIKKSRTQYERSVALRVEANVLDLPIDAVSMRPFIEQEPLVLELDQSVAAALGKTISEDLPDRLVESRSQAARLAGMTKLQDIRDALTKYRIAIPEYVDRCKRDIWSKFPGPPQVRKGVSIHHLGQFVVNLRGAEATVKYFKARRTHVAWDISRQVAIAQEVAKKHSG